MPKPPQLFKEIIHHKARERKSNMQKEEFNQIKYQNEFKKKKYDRFELVMPKGQKEVIIINVNYVKCEKKKKNTLFIQND